MIQLTPQMKILVGVAPVDFRNGIDGLVGVCRGVLAAEPFSGTLFVFCNRRRTAIKAIVYDTQGFWMFQKRLSQGRFCWWPTGTDQPACSLAVHELQTLLWNGDPRLSRTAPAWRQIAVG